MLQAREQHVQRPRVKRGPGEFKEGKATCSALGSARENTVRGEAGRWVEARPISQKEGGWGAYGAMEHV